MTRFFEWNFTVKNLESILIVLQRALEFHVRSFASFRLISRINTFIIEIINYDFEMDDIVMETRVRRFESVKVLKLPRLW